MRTASRLSPAQQAARTWRNRDGRIDTAFMSNEARRAAGLMDRSQAVAHERLTNLHHTRCADRTRGPVPDDIWATGGGPDAA